MLSYFINKHSNIKACIPFINKLYPFSKYSFNENNKTYNKLVGITMQNEKVKNKSHKNYTNSELGRKKNTEEHFYNSNNHPNNRVTNDSNYSSETRDFDKNSNLQRNYNNSDQDKFGMDNSRNLNNQINYSKSKSQGSNNFNFQNDASLEKDFIGINCVNN